MSRVLKKELQKIQENLMLCFRETLPTKQFNAILFLVSMDLGLLVEEEEKNQNQKERRRIIHEFNKERKIIRKGIQRIYEQTKRKPPEPTELLQQKHLP